MCWESESFTIYHFSTTEHHAELEGQLAAAEPPDLDIISPIPRQFPTIVWPYKAEKAVKYINI